MSYNIGQNIQYEHKLKDEIYKRGYTIQSFAEFIGIERHALINIFKNSGKSTRGDTINLISKGLDMPYEEVKELCKRI